MNVDDGYDNDLISFEIALIKNNKHSIVCKTCLALWNLILFPIYLYAQGFVLYITVYNYTSSFHIWL